MLNVIRRSATVPLQIDHSPYPVLGQQAGTYWLDLSEAAAAADAAAPAPPGGVGSGASAGAAHSRPADAGDSKGDAKLPAAPAVLERKESVGAAAGSVAAHNLVGQSVGNALVGQRPTFSIAINGKPTQVAAEIIHAARGHLELWFSWLIDEIAAELAMLAVDESDNKTAGAGNERRVEKKGKDKDKDDAKKQPIATRLHIELLQMRVAAIGPKLSLGSQNANRLEQLVGALHRLRKGDAVSAQKLSDIKSEGQFATKKLHKPGDQKLLSNPPASGSGSGAGSRVESKRPGAVWSVIAQPAQRLYAPKNGAEVWKVMAQMKRQDAVAWVSAHAADCKDQRDEKGSTPLIVAAALGHTQICQALLESKSQDLEAKNHDGHNAADLAIIFGWCAHSSAVSDSFLTDSCFARNAGSEPMSCSSRSA